MTLGQSLKNTKRLLGWDLVPALAAGLAIAFPSPWAVVAACILSNVAGYIEGRTRGR